MEHRLDVEQFDDFKVKLREMLRKVQVRFRAGARQTLRESLSQEAAAEVIRLWGRALRNWQCLSSSFRDAAPMKEIKSYVEFLDTIMKELFRGNTWNVDRQGQTWRVQWWPFTDGNPMEIPDGVPEPVTPNPRGGSDDEKGANPGAERRLRLLTELQTLCV